MDDHGPARAEHGAQVALEPYPYAYAYPYPTPTPTLDQVRKYVAMLKERRFHVCLSLWDPHIPVMHDSLWGAQKLKVVNPIPNLNPKPHPNPNPDPDPDPDPNPEPEP